MHGSRITSEEKSTISTYVGVIIAVVLIAGGLYIFFLAQKEKSETTGFDPNRSVPSDAVLKRRLKAEEYFVVREGGSQMPFQNEFWDNQRVGIYVDVITGEPLFTSLDKFDNGTGLPLRASLSGLATLRERAEELGGRLEMSPSSDGGLLVAWTIPI